MVPFAQSGRIIGLVAIALSAGCSAANAKVTRDSISWEGGAARICVTDRSASCPVDPAGKVSGGRAFWVIDATCFRGGRGIAPPVTYGIVPACAKDVTRSHGGASDGPADLQIGETYKVSIVGFGGTPAIAELSLVP